jgi:hypothetical protein
MGYSHLKDCQETRYVVRITFGYSGCSGDLIYFRNGLTKELFDKWRWYFEYRAALFKVENPRMPVSYYTAGYAFESSEKVFEQRLKNLVINRKAQLTQFNKKLAFVKANWNSLFPIETDKDYCKVVNKLNKLVSELDEAEDKLEAFYRLGYVQEKQEITWIDKRKKNESQQNQKTHR